MTAPEEQYGCPACGHGPVTRSVHFCPSCHQPLGRNRLRWSPESSVDAAATTIVSGPGSRSTVSSTTAAAASESTPPATTRDQGLVLRFPWGPVPLVGQLEIGRDAQFSPLASHLASYDNISREHAEVCVESGSVVVTDIGSMNGTFVNDQRLAIDEPRRLEVGDIVRFAARLEARVERAVIE